MEQDMVFFHDRYAAPSRALLDSKDDPIVWEQLMLVTPRGYAFGDSISVYVNVKVQTLSFGLKLISCSR